MTEAGKMFPIDQEFWYSPLADPSVEVLVMPVKDTNSDIALHNCARDCALNRFCISSDNSDEDGAIFVPACGPAYRKDGNNVHFVEV